MRGCSRSGPQEGETVAVAAATGPVGTIVGQIANIKGANSVGIAGGPDKVAHLKELGFDVALDHRSREPAEPELKEAVPQGIDVYYENVGGDVFNAVLPRLNTYARVPSVRSRRQLQPHVTARGTGPFRSPHGPDPHEVTAGARLHPDGIRRAADSGSSSLT